MATLESLTPGARVRGLTTDGPIEVVNAKWFGDSAVELTYKMSVTGAVGTRIVYRDDEPSLDVIEQGLPWSFTLEIEASIPNGTPEHVIRIVTKNSRSLKFDDSGFENE